MCFTNNFVHRDCGILPVNIGSTVPSFGSFILVLSRNLSPLISYLLF